MDLTDVNETLKLSLEISKFLENLVGKIHLRHNLDRQTIIRRLLRHCRAILPQYNVVIYVPESVACSVEKIFEKKFEMQDLVTKFKFTICVFTTGTITILRGLNDGNKWGNIK